MYTTFRNRVVEYVSRKRILLTRQNLIDTLKNTFNILNESVNFVEDGKTRFGAKYEIIRIDMYDSYHEFHSKIGVDKDAKLNTIFVLNIWKNELFERDPYHNDEIMHALNIALPRFICDSIDSIYKTNIANLYPRISVEMPEGIQEMMTTEFLYMMKDRKGAFYPFSDQIKYFFRCLKTELKAVSYFDYAEKTVKMLDVYYISNIGYEMQEVMYMVVPHPIYDCEETGIPIMNIRKILLKKYGTEWTQHNVNVTIQYLRMLIPPIYRCLNHVFENNNCSGRPMTEEELAGPHYKTYEIGPVGIPVVTQDEVDRYKLLKGSYRLSTPDDKHSNDLKAAQGFDPNESEESVLVLRDELN